MKKASRGIAILVILFALVNIIAFVLPTMKTGSFWIAYAFTVVAFAVQIVIWKIALGKDETLKSKFLGFPVVHIGIVYLAVQLGAFAVFMFVPILPAWCTIVACAVIAGLSAICMIAPDAGRNEIERVELKVQKKVFYIKNLQVEVELLTESENDAAAKTALVKLAEKIRFSDPMSSEQLIELEDRISAKIKELKTTENKVAIINELNLLLNERNKKCKILK